MNRNEIIKQLEIIFPPSTALADDYIGLQIDGSVEIKKILICLDITFDVIQQAIEKKVELIISHHPLFFGNRENLLKTDKFLKALNDLLIKQAINIYIIHTNADFNLHSISKFQALNSKINGKISHSKNNQAIKLDIDNEMKLSINEISDLLRKNLNLTEIQFRTNIPIAQLFNQIYFTSGAGADFIYELNSSKALLVTGEVKHHHWVYANQHDLSILEISHFSEYLFCLNLKELLEKTIKLPIIIAKERIPYETI